MKKLILAIVVFSVLFISCDEEYTDNFFVKNNCDIDVSVKITLWNDQEREFIVTAHTFFLFHEEVGIRKLKLEEIRDICKTIVVSKNDTLSSVNYNERWQLEPVSDTETKHFFEVNSEDFE